MDIVKFVGLSCIVCFTNAYAYWSPVLSVSFGVNQNNLGRTQTIYLDEFSNTYVKTNGSNKNKAIFGIFGGAESRSRSDKFSSDYSNWMYQIGLGLYQNEAANVSGVVNEFSLPEFDNLNYKYYVRSRYALVEGRILYKLSYFLAPYIMAGGGVSTNKAHNYYETPRIDTAVPMAPFASQSKTAAAYTVGTGIELMAMANLRFGLGYRYANLGGAKLGRSPAQSTNDTLSINKVNSHQLLFQISSVG